MAGPTYFLNGNPNDFSWPEPAKSYSQFEDLIESYIKLCSEKQKKERKHKIRIKKTPRSRDKGKDIILDIEKGSIELFGILFDSSVYSKSIYIECKATSNAKLNDSFIVDSSQHDSLEASAYLLVTNTTITPYSFIRGRNSWHNIGMDFYLVDGFRLAQSFIKNDFSNVYTIEENKLLKHSDIPNIDISNPIISYQYEDDGDRLKIYLSISNYSTFYQTVSISFLSDMFWELDEEDLILDLRPGDTIVKTLDASALTAESKEVVRLNIQHEDQYCELSITPNLSLLPSFETYFTGKKHRKIKKKISKVISKCNSVRLISIHGEAGIGKTRTVQEALNQFRGRSEVIIESSFEESGLLTFSREINEIVTQNISTRNILEVIKALSEYRLPVVLLIEDIHHAAPEELKKIKIFCSGIEEYIGKLTVIITGRDDHTFPNAEYFSLLTLIQKSNNNSIVDFKIEKLDDDSAKELINSTTSDFPEVVKDQVLKLGENNPFVILEVFLYLVDMDEAEIVSRRTIGLLHPESFSAKNGLPSTISDIYKSRLESLDQEDGGKLALNFLIAASFFGFNIKDELWNSYFNGQKDAKTAKELLYGRFFIKRSDDRGLRSFFHENLLHNLKEFSHKKEVRSRSSGIFMDRPILLSMLDSFVRADVFLLNEDYQLAFNSLSPIWDELIKIENYSALEIDRSYFRFIPTLFLSAKEIGEDSDNLIKVVTAYSYMAVHNFPLVKAISCCNDSIEWIKEISSYDKEDLAIITQLRSHALQNIGLTGEAFKYMAELQAQVEIEGQEWDPSLKFDLYDRLQEHYRKTNHAELSDKYGKLATNEAMKVGDSLMMCNAITQSGRYLYSGMKKAQKWADKASSLAAQSDVERLKVYTRLTHLVIEVIYNYRDKDKMSAIYQEASEMLELCCKENYADSIMRLELLLAVVSLYHFECKIEAMEKAKTYIKAGLNDSARFGNGLFDWAFHNLAGVIYEVIAVENRAEARRHFETCRQVMKIRGVSFFGDKSAIFPSALALSNIIRFHSSTSPDRVAIRYLKATASSYSSREFYDNLICSKYVKDARDGKPILWKRGRKATGPRLEKKGYFTIIF